MTEIVGSLDIRKFGADRWTILRDLKLVSNTGKWVLLKRWFILDFGSIPRIPPLRSIVPPLGSEADIGFAGHDGVHAWHRDNSPLVIVSDPFTFTEAADFMTELHLHCGVHPALATAMNVGVKLGAIDSWETPAERMDRLDTGDDSFLDG